MGIDEFKTTYPFTMDGQVEWADMDAFAHLNNTVVFRYFERVRIALVDHLGFIDHRSSHGIGPILAETRCRFKAPMYYPDKICIGTGIKDLQVDCFLMIYGIYCERLGRIAAEGDGLMVCYDYNKNSKAPLPVDVHEALAGYLVND